MLIANATVLTPHAALDNAAVRVLNSRIAAIFPQPPQPAPCDEETFDAQGLILAPGFVDLQINGAFGHDFTRDPAAIWHVASQLPRYGVTTFLPTIITSPPAAIAAAQQALQQPPAAFQGAHPLGLHLEGPFLNPQKKGAHDAAHLCAPRPALIAGWSPQSGVRLVTLAPELPGALDLVSRLVHDGIVISAGHSMATLEEGQAALNAGVRYGTHLFNAMPPLHHRQPGLAAALLADERATVGLIADGVHVHPALVALFWRLLGPARLTLVTDAIAALGVGPGTFTLGNQAVTVRDGRATLPDGTLAGSALSLDAAVRNLRQITGCSLSDAVHTVTSTPAKLLNLSQKGAIVPGADADLVLLTPDLHVAATFVAGKMVYNGQHQPSSQQTITEVRP